MTGVAIATGLAAVATGVGAYINAEAQRDANIKNVDLMREQMKYQTSERLAAQQYNLPANQRARFEAAGINPYMALGQIDAGNTTAMSAPGAPNIQAENYGDVLSSLGSGIRDTTTQMQAVQQIQAQNEAIKQAKVDTLYKERNVIADLNNKRADYELKLASKGVNEEQKKVLQKQIKELDNQIKLSTIDADYHEQLVRSRNSREENMSRLAYEQTLAQQLQNNYQTLVNEAFPALNAAQIRALNASATQSYAAANLSNKMSETEVEKKAGLITANQIAALEKNGWKRNYEAEQKLKQANINYINASKNKVQNMDNWVQNYSPAINLLAGGAGAAAMKMVPK